MTDKGRGKAGERRSNFEPGESGSRTALVCPLTAKLGAPGRAEFERAGALERTDVARVVALLASPEAGMIQGQAIRVDGGLGLI